MMLQKFDERNRELIVNVNGELVHRHIDMPSPSGGVGLPFARTYRSSL